MCVSSQASTSTVTTAFSEPLLTSILHHASGASSPTTPTQNLSHAVQLFSTRTSTNLLSISCETKYPCQQHLWMFSILLLLSTSRKLRKLPPKFDRRRSASPPTLSSYYYFVAP
uniref:Uncharacterized protein n=1 Tax=Plectus sambesii TaxID=2011161 RepID=A0A914VHP6_9BILA